MFTREQVEQRIAVVYKAGFHAGAKWAKGGDAHERTQRHESISKT